MTPGQKVVLLRGPFFGMPVYSTVKRSTDGDWTVNGKRVGWLHYHQSPRIGSCVIHWLRTGPLVWMLSYGRPTEAKRGRA